MTQPDETLENLLQEIQRTIITNRRFIDQLKDDSIDDELTEETVSTAENPDDGEFEEL